MNRKIFLKSRGIALEAKAKQLNPNIRPILLIFDPIEFPNAISGVSLSTDDYRAYSNKYFRCWRPKSN